MMQIYKTQIKSYEARTETVAGVSYKIVPVVMLTEGVHNGSHGAVFHSADELSRYVEAWNGIPVTLRHPKVQDSYVPANSPEVLAEFYLGRVFNAQMENNKLKAEIWFETTKLADYADLEGRVDKGEVIEISTGLFSDEEEVEGVWNNEEYSLIAHNYRPEHLAVLPDEVGACSAADGCGIRVNSNKNNMAKETDLIVNADNKLAIFKELNKTGVVLHFSVLKEGMQATVEKVRESLYSLDNEEASYYLEEVYDDALIYHKYNRPTGKHSYYKRGYSIQNGKVVLNDDIKEVVKEILYNEITEINNNSSKTTKSMSKEEKCPTCVKKVDTLIANTATRYTEKDRDWMENLSVEQLDQMIPVVEKETVTPEIAVNTLKESWKTPEDTLSAMPDHIKVPMEAALKVYADHKNSLVSTILDNTEEGVWDKEELEVMQVNQLEKIAKTAKKAQTVQSNEDGQSVEDSGFMAGNLFVVNASSDEDEPVMLPNGVQIEEKK